MKHIRIIDSTKYKDETAYHCVETGIYKTLLNDGLVGKGDYVLMLSMELEEKRGELENRQYPLEDLLDNYYGFISDFIQDEEDNPVLIVEICTSDSLADSQKFKALAGKTVFNQTVQRDGETVIELIIE